MNKKILHILTGMARGGCEGNALCLISQVRDCQHEVLVLGEEGEMSGEFKEAGARLYYLNPSLNPWTLCDQIRSEQAAQTAQGVIVWHGMVMLPQMLHALAGTGIPVLVHGGNPAHSMPWWVDWRYVMLEGLLGARAAATYVCCSRHVADSFQHSRYLRRFPWVVVPNGVKPMTLPPHEPRSLQGGKPAIIGMVARLDGIKDHATLLKAFAVVLQKYPQTVLELAGEGEKKASLEALAADLGITQQIRFLGMVKDVYARIINWDVFAYATTSLEGLGNALAEAMTAGLPCVATDIGPVREVAGEPAVINLVPPADADAMAACILRVLTDLDARKIDGAAGRSRALKKFSQLAYAQSYLKLLFPY